MFSAADRELELSRKSFRGDDALGDLDLRKIRHERWEKAASPCRHHCRRVIRVCDSGEKVIPCVERDEAFRVLRGEENARSVIDADDLIQRRMHDQHRTPQRGDGLLDVEPNDCL